MEDRLTRINELRTTPRFEYKVEVTFESDHRFYSGLTNDVGGGGLFIATNVFRPIGECIRVRFTLPGSTVLQDAITEVRWVRGPDATDGEPGMGLQFVQLSPKTKQAIKDFLKQRESITHDE
jgi:uncharacterized protein (TIGR02266 family)